MKTHNTKMKGKKVLSLLLALIMVLSVGSPAFSEMFGITAGAATDAASDAYATVVTASDFQDGRSGNDVEANFSAMIKKAKADGVNEPDGFILGGDYESSNAEDHDTPTAYRRVESIITNAYPYFNRNNIVNIQGNHDVNDPSVIDKTGPHEYEDYIVYVINTCDYPSGTGKTAAYNKTLETNKNLVAYFNKLKSEGETRPIFIATHIPLHHNFRNHKADNKDENGNVVSTGWNETLYSRILFETINENAKIFDIVFLFGHNHSGPYDDYIGGSVNYIGKGETILISDYTLVPGENSCTEETLNFTYMNYGYVGYSNNENNSTLTMNAFEICPDKIVATRYSVNGRYKTEIIDRNMKTNTPSVTVDGYSEGKVGSAAGVVAIASGFEDPVFTWSSSNNSVAKISCSDRVAEIAYNSVGTATIEVKVTERNESSKSAIYNYDVTVSEDAGSTPGVAIYRGKEQVDNRTLDYYQINLGDTVALSGKYYGLTETASTAWSSSDTGVVKVNKNGLVTFVGAGKATITYIATDKGVDYQEEVEFNVSTGKRFEYKYIQTKTITAGKSYVLATAYNNATVIYNDKTTITDNVTALSGLPTTFQGSSGSYYLQLNDESYVWNAVEATVNNQFYLQNADSGLYLAAYKSENSSDYYGHFELTQAKPSNGIWQLLENKTLQTTDGWKWRARTNGSCSITKGEPRDVLIFEQVPLEAYANIEFSGEVVNDKNKTVHLAINGRQIELDRDLENIKQLKSEKWTSSDTNVATIDNNGVVTFKGVQGETKITYTATDAVNGKTVTASFTLSAMLTAKETRLFKYTENVTPGKRYVIANKKDTGVANAFSSFEVSYTKLLADRVDVTVEDGASYIEIPEELNEVVWIPESADGSSFYLRNEANKKYLYANTNGTYDGSSLNSNVYTSSSYDTNTEQYKWTYEGGSKLHNQFEYEDTKLGAQTKTYMRVRTAEFSGTATESESKVYFYEEINAKPKAVIMSRFEVLGEIVERTEICPFQTEQLLPAAEHFPDNSKVSFAWSSDNTTIAEIDQNGEITYTGKAGKVTITLTATSQVQDSNDAYPVATSTVTIEVIGGVGYVAPTLETFELTDKLVDGQKFVFRATKTDESGSAISLALSGEAASGTGEAAERLMGVSVTPIDNIITTDNHNIIWVAEASGENFYLRNYKTGEYLAIFATGNLVKTTSDKTNDNLLRYYEKSTGNMCFSLSTTNNSIRYKDGAFYESSSGASFELYAYTGSVEIEDNTPVITEIRKQDDFGSVDITRKMQYRYDINPGATEQVLRYIRGVAFGYTTSWSVSDTEIATIDQNGVLTYKGETGYVDVMLTVEGKDFKGNDITRTIKTTFDISAEADKTRIAIPETVYMTPASGASKVGEIYVNNVMNAKDFYNVETIAEREDDMYFGLRVAGAKSFTVSVSNATDPSNDINLYKSDGSVVSETTAFDFNDAGVFENDGGYSLRFSGAGLNPGEKATARWDVTVTMNDSTTTHTYTLYTVMYAPGRTVGAVAESHANDNSLNEVSSWITGANGVDHSKRSPLGGFHGDVHDSGYFKQDPLYSNAQSTGGESYNSHDYINTDHPSYLQNPNNNDDYSKNAYVLQTATDGDDGSRAQSYLGLLTVDGSRYSNTNQIPNLEIGYDALRAGSLGKDSFYNYTTYYTLGSDASFVTTEDEKLNEKPIGWSTYTTYTRGQVTPALREHFAPSYNVSNIDKQYIHALVQAESYQLVGLLGYGIPHYYYATAGTSVLCSVTDKSVLRERVLSGYSVTDGTAEFNEALKNAAAVLGNPAATQTEINTTSRKLYEAMEDMADIYYPLKYDNLFSAFEYAQFDKSMSVVEDRGTASYLNGTITVVNGKIEPKKDANGNVINGEAYTNYGSSDSYYHVELKPNTEYVFEYDVETTLNAQAFMFFYNSSGGNSEAPTNMSIKVNDGAWGSKSEANSWWGNYTNGKGTYHYVIKFTTGATTVKAGFRFGNTSLEPVTSTFSNIKLIDSAHYYEDAQYSKTESIHKEYTRYGSLITLERPGYSFMGWKDINGSTVTSANNATEHLTIYSQWEETQYKVKFNGNGGAGSTTSATLTLNQSAVLPADFTRDRHTFLGWSFDDDATAPDFTAGQIITVADILDYIDISNQVTLYAVWSAVEVNITFDNLIDISKVKDGLDNDYVDVIDKTDIGFTLEAVSGGDDCYSKSTYNIPVEPNTTYIFTADIKHTDGNLNNDIGYEIYAKVKASDGTPDTDEVFDKNCKLEGDYYKTKDKSTFTFTTSSDSAYISLRFDVNDYKSVMTVENIRLWKADGTTVSPVNKVVNNGNRYGTLPEPTREGYTFLGWYDVNDTKVTAGDIVTNTYTTALKSKWQINNSALKEDKAVVDFGLPMKIDPVDNDTILKTEINGKGYSIALGAVGSDSFGATYGKFSVSGTDVIYTPSTVAGEIMEANEAVDYRVTLNDGTTVKSTITVVPASNMYYEETALALGSASNSKPDWSSNGSAAKANQDTSTDNDVYGKDSAYEGSTGFSNGTYYSTTVTSGNTNSEAASFSFTGTGFDFISACGQNTGVHIVKLYEYTGETTKKLKDMYVVDTYLDDANLFGEDNLLHQVPVISYQSSATKTSRYYVEISAVYMSSSGDLESSGTAQASFSSVTTVAEDGTKLDSHTAIASPEMLKALGMEDAECDVQLVWMDDNSVLNGGMGARTIKENTAMSGSAGNYYNDSGLVNYIDGFRVYKNGGYSSYIDSESNPTYYNIINELGLDELAADKNMIYVEANKIGTTDFDFNAYKLQSGPKGEIYLKGGQGIAFKINVVTTGDDVANVMLGMRAVKGSATANVYTDASKELPAKPVISSATEMYYDVSPAVTVENGSVTVYVANTSENENDIIALNNLKLINGNLKAEDTIYEPIMGGSNAIIGGTAPNPTPVVPNGAQGDAGNVEDIPESDINTDINTDINAPEADTEVEDNTEGDSEGGIITMFPAIPAPIASFLELLFKLLTQLLGSLGF